MTLCHCHKTSYDWGIFILSMFIHAVYHPRVNAFQTSLGRPNIILIITDDQGYGDASCHGNPVLKTPQLDRLHRESVRFVDFHVSPTCSPTRAALMSGRHEFKNGVTHTIYERERLALGTRTLAEVLHSVGYTTAIFGKWHLGDEADYQPDRRGFDEVFIHGGGGIGQTYPGSCGDAPGNSYFDPVIKHNGRFIKTQGYCTDVFFQQAIRWIDDHLNDHHAHPFFIYLATNAPHAPLDVPDEYARRYQAKVSEQVAKYYGMISNIDDNLGLLLDHLDRKGLAQRTLIIFLTDNGGTYGVPIYNAGMRGQKGTPWQGGTRAISFWRWHGTFPARDVSALAAHIDVLPTLMDLLQIQPDDLLRQQVEGISLLPWLKGDNPPEPERFLFTHVGRWGRDSDGRDAKLQNARIRWKQYSLVCAHRETKGQWQLFDLKHDPAEQQNIASEHPEIVHQMLAAYDRWWDDLPRYLVNEKQQGPKHNPFHIEYWRQFRGPGPNQVPPPEDVIREIMNLP